MNNVIPDDIMDAAEAAKFLGISIYTLRSWVSQKRIPYIKLGRRVLFSRQVLQEFLRKHTVEPQTRRGIA